MRFGRNRQAITSSSEAWPSEARIKHLEFIQSVVTRLSTNSFLAKGWALTVDGAIYAFAASHLDPWVAGIGLVTTLGFWWLDSYFLRQERLFRCLYDDARQPDTPVVLFSMHVVIYRSKPFVRWRGVIFSSTLRVFYGMLMLVGIAILGAGVVHNSLHKHPARISSAVSSRTSSGIKGLGGHISPIWSSCHRGTR
jgi:hypothetical protein